MSGDTQIGLEVDGTRVTVVESLGGMAVASRSVSMGSMKESLEVALSGIPAKKGSAPIRVAVVCAGATMRRIDVTRQVLASRQAFEDAVFEVLPMAKDVTSVGGVFMDRDGMVGEAVSTGVAAVMPISIVEEVYSVLGSRRAEVVASPLTLGEYDGVWVGLHQSAAEVTLVKNGFPMAFRQLRAGGLSTVASVLGDSSEPGTGTNRLAASLARTAADPIADAEVSRYLRMVGAELAQTLAFWQTQGEEVPEGGQVIVYGLGGSALTLKSALAEAGLTPVMPEEMITQLAYVNPSEREAATLAYMASLTVGQQMPQASFTNPKADQVRESAKASKKRLFRLAAVIGVTLVLLFAFGLPFISGWLDAQSAASERQSAESAAAAIGGVYHQVKDLEARADVITGATATEPQWSSVLKDVYGTKPEGSTVIRIVSRNENGQVLVTVDATKPGGDYDELAAWLGKLTDERSALDAWTTGFSYANGITSYQVTFRLDTRDVPSARSPMAPAAPASSDADAIPSGTDGSAPASAGPASTAPSEAPPSTAPAASAAPAPSPSPSEPPVSAAPAPAPASPSAPSSPEVTR